MGRKHLKDRINALEVAIARRSQPHPGSRFDPSLLTELQQRRLAEIMPRRDKRAAIRYKPDLAESHLSLA